MKYLIKSEIPNGGIICSSDYIEAKNEKEAIMNWIYKNYKTLKTDKIGFKIGFKDFKLEIEKAKIIKRKFKK